MTGEWWLGVRPHERFAALAEYSFSERDSFYGSVIPYLAGRGADDDALMIDLVETDLANLAQAFTILFATDHEVVLKEMMPDHLYTVIHDVGTTIDHVGREIIGPLEYYLRLMRDLAAASSLAHAPRPSGPMITPDGDAIFPSVQVVEALRQRDPETAGVTIGKTFFGTTDGSSYLGCLELFQPALRSGTAAQPYGASLGRLSALTNSETELETPICHIGIQAEDLDTVHDMHRVAAEDTTGLLRTYLDDVMENPNDGSTLTKILMRSSTASPNWNRILEVNHHVN